MSGSPADVAVRHRAREHVVVHVDSPAARWIGALALMCAAGWLSSSLPATTSIPDWHYTDRLGWSLTVLGAVAFIARGIFLGRPVTTAHAAAAGPLRGGGAGLARAVLRSARRPADCQLRNGADVGDLVASAARGPAPGVDAGQRHHGTTRWRPSPCRRASAITSPRTGRPPWRTGRGWGSPWSAPTRSGTRTSSANWSPISPRPATPTAGGSRWWGAASADSGCGQIPR